MALTLKLRIITSIPIDLDGVVPDHLVDKSLAEIEKIPIYEGNRKLALADAFEVSGCPSDGRIDLEGDLAGVHSIGYAMKTGELHIHGARAVTSAPPCREAG